MSLDLNKKIISPFNALNKKILNKTVTIAEFEKSALDEIEDSKNTIKTVYKNEIYDIDLNNVKVGAQVYHKAFGYGIITDIKKDIIFVKFDDIKNEKSFAYPGCFTNGFLRLD